jgi:hypothetical protein
VGKGAEEPMMCLPWTISACWLVESGAWPL